MGSSNSKSSTSQNITNNTINQNLMSTVNENLMNVSTDTLIKNASSASSSVSQNNVCKTEVGNVSGDFIFGGNQSNDATVNFAAVQSGSAANDMSTAMMQNMVSQMKSLNGTDNAAALNNAASSAASQGSLTTGGSVSSDTDSKTKVTNNVTNETLSYVQNLFSQNIKNNFSAETVNQCIGKTTQTNEQDVKAGNVGGNAKISCIQTNTVEQVQKCEQLATAINETMLKTAAELGLTVVAESETTSATESSISASSSSTQTGFFQDVGSMFASIFGSLSTGMIVFIIAIAVVGMFVAYSLFFGNKDVSVDQSGISVTGRSQGGGVGSIGSIGGGKKFDSSTSFILTDSSSSSSIYDSSSSSYFTWVNAPENILSGASGKDFIMSRDILITL